VILVQLVPSVQLVLVVLPASVDNPAPPDPLASPAHLVTTVPLVRRVSKEILDPRVTVVLLEPRVPLDPSDLPDLLVCLAGRVLVVRRDRTVPLASPVPLAVSDPPAQLDLPVTLVPLATLARMERRVSVESLVRLAALVILVLLAHLVPRDPRVTSALMVHPVHLDLPVPRVLLDQGVSWVCPELVESVVSLAPLVLLASPASLVTLDLLVTAATPDPPARRA